MKARTLTHLLRKNDHRLDGFERRLHDVFEEVLAEVAVGAGDRFAAVAGHQEPLVAAAPTASSAMIAVYPSDEQQAILAYGGTEPPEQIHCTLAFLGEVEPDQAEAAAAVVQKVACQMSALSGEVGGIAAFGDNGDGHPSILLPDVVGLAELRHAVVCALEEAGIEFSTSHGWTPHLTLGYTADPSPPSHRMIGCPLDFSQLSLAVGDRRRDFDLGPPLAASGGLIGRAYVRVYSPEELDARAIGESMTAGAIVAETDKGAEIGAVAEDHAPDGGYGDTAWNASTGTVYWVSADWSTNDEVDEAAAAFLAIDEVEAFEYDAETGLPDGDEWEVVYSSAALAPPDDPPDDLTAAAPPNWMSPHPDEVIDVEALLARFRSKSDPVRLAVVEAVASPALEKAGLSFDATNSFVDAVLAKTGAQIKFISDTTRLNVMRIIRQSYELGLSIPDTAKAIQEGMLAAAPARATLIARTEMVGLVNGGSLAATRIVDEALSEDGQGGAYRKRWLTAPGASFPRHELYEGLDGQTVALDAFFDLEGDQLQYPGDPAGSPENVCNCRCTLVYVDSAGGDAGVEDSATAAGLPFDETQEEESVTAARAGISRKPELEVVEAAAELAPNALEEQLSEPVTYALGWPNREGVEPRADGHGGVPGFGNVSSVFVRIRPQIDSAEIEQAASDAAALYRESLRGELADLPVELLPSETRPERTDGADVPVADDAATAPRASQVAWEAVLMPEGKLTDDGRIFAPGSVSWRELPLSLMAMTVTGEGGHVGAALAGRMTRIWRDESVTPTLIRAEGVFDDNEYGAEIARLVGDQTLRGNSVDTAIREVEFGPRDLYVDENGLWKDDAPAAGEGADPIEMLLDDGTDPPIMVARDAVIGMSTVCPFPAFEDAGIILASGELPEFAIASDATGFRWRIWLKDSVSPAADVLTASAAGLAPLEPPAEWFDEPTFDELTALTVDDEGRVYGHAAAWGVCHLGLPGACTTAPSSESDYAYFHLKEVVVEGGERIACGTITLGTGHAGKTLSRAAAAEHYDHTGTAVADVRVGEDEFGIWVAGALRPDVPAGRVRELRGSSLSGDWRKVEGYLELVGLLAVNVPGFPVPRPRALVAAADDGLEILSLTAAGVHVSPEKFSDADRARFAALAARAEGGLEALVDLAVAEPAAPAPESLREALLAAAGAEPTDLVQTTYDLTRGTLTERRFLSEVLAAGFRETRRSSWPSEATLGEHGDVIERGDGEAVFRIGDTLVYAAIGGGWAYFRVAAASPATTEETLSAFSVAYPPLYRKADESLTVPITFWTLGAFGPQSRLRVIESAAWDDVAANYSADVKGELERLMSPDFEPGENGQLLLWQGEPGTGKTWALRALASQWSEWAEFAYITDPDAFFVRDPSYMIDVLLHESYETLTVDGDVVSDSDPEGKWRVLILEDTGELLSANAKEAYGQGLSRLLNVVDGMVGQGLRVLALLTTNDELGDLHPAAIRPGRCASRIEFGPLSADEASAWLGEDVDAPATLAELYERKGGAAAALAATDESPEAVPAVEE